MGTLLRRHATLVAFSLSLAGSTAFVACGSDTSTSTIPFPDGGLDTGLGGVANGSGGASSGGKASAGSGGTGGASGSLGGGSAVDSGSDAVTSNGDAQVDGASH